MHRQPKVKRPLTIADLPAPSTDRWVIRGKAEVLAAVHGGLVSLEDVCRRYMLTVEEFLSWQYSIDRHGLAGIAGCAWCEARLRRSDSPPCPWDKGTTENYQAGIAGCAWREARPSRGGRSNIARRETLQP